MMKHDKDFVNRCRPFEDVDASKPTTTTFKRQCLDHDQLSENFNDGFSNGESRMDTSMEEMDTQRHECNLVTTQSKDEILVHMAQSGCYSQEDVVQFCISSGIPLSRMLRLDLMRLSKDNFTQKR